MEETIVAVTVELRDGTLRPDERFCDGGLRLLITKSALGPSRDRDVATVTAQVPLSSPEQVDNITTAVDEVLHEIVLFAPDALIVSVTAAFAAPSDVKKEYMTHFRADDQQDLQTVLDFLLSALQERGIGQTELMHRMNYTRERARAVMIARADTKINVQTLARFARAAGYRLKYTLEEDPEFVAPDPEAAG